MGKKEDIDGKIVEFAKYAKRKGRQPSVTQTVTGDSNTIVAGDYVDNSTTTTIKPKTKNIQIMPPPDSIGADSFLKQTIQEKFNKIGEAREKRFGKRAYSVMYSNFKKAFHIKNSPWTIIWTWPRECADEIIEYLDDLWKQTIPGRIENAAKRPDHLPPRPHLYSVEKEMISHFGLEMNSAEIKQLLQDFFGVTSHKHLTHLQHWQFVKYLQGQVDKLIESL